MKLVQANKFLYPKNGADRYCCTLIEELPKLGIEVVPFGMADDKNIVSPWSKYFAKSINYHALLPNYFQIVTRLIWNSEAASKFGQLLDESKPDLIHAHNIYHQLSPSILVEAKKRQIPVILHLHDYKLICPNYLLFTHGQHCQRCLSGNYLNCLKHNCYYSYPRSFLASLESFLHHKIWHVYRDNIDLFISPSNYLKGLMIKAGWDSQKIIVLINPAPTYFPGTDGDRLLYIGRLSVEKGVDILIRALKLTKEKLDIAGSGADEKKLKLLTKKLLLEDRVIFHGQLGGTALENLRKNAKAIILPSVWAENMSLVLLESLASNKLIIATNSGGTPELIEEGKTGFLVRPGNIKDLAQKINELNNLNSEQRTEMTNLIKEKIIPLELEKHLTQLKNIYKQFNNIK